MYKCPSCEGAAIRGYYPALVTREQDGVYMYRVSNSSQDVDEERDPVRLECVDCREITHDPDSWVES